MNKYLEIKNLFNNVGIVIDGGSKPQFTESLPALYKKRFNFTEYWIDGYNKPILLLEIIKKVDDLNDLVSNLDFLSRNFDGELVVKFDELSSFWRMQLIRARISFIVKEEVYLPFMGALLKPNYEKTVVYSDQFTPAQQHVFISILKRSKIQSSITPKDLVTETHLSLPTVYRSLDLMSHIGIYNNVAKNKHNNWSLAMDTESIWNKGKNLMKSPVVEEVVVLKKDLEKLNKKLDLFISGNEALAHYTNLEKFGNDTYATNIITYNKIKNKFPIYSVDNLLNNEELKYHTHDFVTLEVWSYGPITDNNQSKYVDPISLYVTNKTNTDPRVQSELDDLLEREFMFEEQR